MINSDVSLNSLKISKKDNYKQLFYENYKLFKLYKREAEVFLILFELNMNDKKGKYEHAYIYDQIPEKRKLGISVVHVRNVLNTLVKKGFINYVNKSRDQDEQSKYNKSRINDEEFKALLNKLGKNIKYEDNFKNKLENDIKNLRQAIKNKEVKIVKGKRPRLYFIDENLIINKRISIEQEFEDSLTTSKYGFKISSDGISDLIEMKELYYIDLIKIENLEIELFLKNYLSNDENLLIKNINSISTISILENKVKFSQQKIRKLINQLVQKQFLKEINPNEETTILKKLSETTDLLKTLRPNEKIYQMLPIELAINKFLRKITREYLLKQDLLNLFLKFEEDDRRLDYKTYEILPTPYTEIFQSLKKSFKSVVKLEEEFEEIKDEIKIYKNIFEEMDYGLIFFEDETLKYFDYKAQGIFNLRESEKNNLKYSDFLFKRNIKYVGKGEANLKKYLIDEPRLKSKWSVDIKNSNINYKLIIFSDFRGKHKVYIIIE